MKNQIEGDGCKKKSHFLLFFVTTATEPVQMS